MGLRLTAEEFQGYGASHLTVLALLVAGGVALVWFGRSHRESAAAVTTGKVLGAGIALFTVPLQLVHLTPAYRSLERSIPLALCDLAWMAAVYALWTRRRWAVALTYYWGLSLTTQAVVTPDLSADFPDREFVLFWSLHLLVVWAAVYLTWGLGLTPSWRSYRTALGVTAVWAGIAFCVNALAGTNYGYLNGKPPTASVLDLLGPWPWYVAAEVVVVATVWALMTWPWVALRRAPVGTSRRRVASG